MKGKVLDWPTLQQQNPKQTATLVSYRVHRKDGSLFTRTRVLINSWMSREEAWSWCQANDIRRKVTYQGEECTEMNVRLLRLDKVIRDLAERRPKDVSALKVV